MNNYKQLKDKIRSRKAKICIMGLGYVGLPLAVLLAKKGFFVYGYDPSVSRIKKLFKGQRYIVDVDPKEALSLIKKRKFHPCSYEKVLCDSDIIIVCVPTPLRKVKLPDVSYVISASRTIKKNLRPPQLIILESTSYPTTTRGVLLPILEKSGLKSEKDFFVCFSPERVNPGDKKFPVQKIPKAVGGISEQSGILTKELYSTIMDKVYVVSSPEVAEASKLLENTFRLVNIALINEFAMVCHKLGISVWEVIESSKTKPFGFMPFYPGPGIGGHCIPCDPIFLSWKAKKLGFKTKMIDLASYMNHYMPRYIIERTETLLRQNSIALRKAKVLVLGVAYKKDVKDLRESPALDIIEELKRKKVKVDYSDPFFPYLKINSIDLKGIPLTRHNIKKYDCIVLVTDHTSINYKMIQKSAKLIFDTRNIYKKNYSNVIKL
ncbi:nucleotide sugar dehydrogenase [Thermoproteota archaeon]